MNAPIKALVGMLRQSAKPSRIDRLLAQSKAGIIAAHNEAEEINATWRALSDAEKQRRLYPKSDVQFDRDRDLDERGILAGDAWADEHPMQSSATSRRY